MARKPVFINANNNGYTPSQCGPTLTVGELIEILSDFDDEQPVYLKFDYGYSYGNIGEHAFELGEEELEEDE